MLMDLNYLHPATTKESKLHFCVHFHFLMLQTSPRRFENFKKSLFFKKAGKTRENVVNMKKGKKQLVSKTEPRNKVKPRYTTSSKVVFLYARTTVTTQLGNLVPFLYKWHSLTKIFHPLTINQTHFQILPSRYLSNYLPMAC